MDCSQMQAMAILFWSYFFFLVPIFKQNASDVSFLGRIFFFHTFLTDIFYQTMKFLLISSLLRVFTMGFYQIYQTIFFCSL